MAIFVNFWQSISHLHGQNPHGHCSQLSTLNGILDAILAHRDTGHTGSHRAQNVPTRTLSANVSETLTPFGITVGRCKVRTDDCSDRGGQTLTAPEIDMSEKSVMITGATAGIGEAAAFALAEMGADLTIVCRNANKGKETVAEIQKRHPKGKASMLVGDLGVQADIRRMASEFLATSKPLHVLFNNAGVVQLGRSTTADGLETTFAVNHLGPFLLTALLLERLRASAPARVVCTASDAHKFSGGSLDFDDLQSESGYTTFGAYGRSKLCNILFTAELGRREREAGSQVNAYCFHPGFVGSDFAKNNGVIARVIMTMISSFARTSEKGAETGVYLCSSPNVADQTGGYYFNMASHEPASYAKKSKVAERLWEVSEKLTEMN